MWLQLFWVFARVFYELSYVSGGCYAVSMWFQMLSVTRLLQCFNTSFGSLLSCCYVVAVVFWLVANVVGGY